MQLELDGGVHRRLDLLLEGHVLDHIGRQRLRPGHALFAHRPRPIRRLRPCRLGAAHEGLLGLLEVALAQEAHALAVPRGPLLDVGAEPAALGARVVDARAAAGARLAVVRRQRRARAVVDGPEVALGAHVARVRAVVPAELRADALLLRGDRQVVVAPPRHRLGMRHQSHLLALEHLAQRRARRAALGLRDAQRVRVPRDQHVGQLGSLERPAVDGYDAVGVADLALVPGGAARLEPRDAVGVVEPEAEPLGAAVHHHDPAHPLLLGRLRRLHLRRPHRGLGGHLGRRARGQHVGTLVGLVHRLQDIKRVLRARE